MDEMMKMELDDDQLDQVAGGTEIQASVTGRKYKTTCDDFVCKHCGSRPDSVHPSGHYCEAFGGESNFDAWYDYVCDNCVRLPNCQNYTGLGAPTPPAN